MRFSILHISDLHRDLRDEVANNSLLESLERDFNQFTVQTPNIMAPALCIVSGDLISGIRTTSANADIELNRQYEQAKEFLIALTNRFFNRNRNRVVILPGNHDVCFTDVIESSQKIEIPTEPFQKKELVNELFSPNSKLRWSWNEMCFFKIIDDERYLNRFRHFAALFEGFYEGQRTYPILPEKQFSSFDFPDLSFCVLALNSCYNNDPFRRMGAFHPGALTEACRSLRQIERSGWLSAAAWHHNFAGGPLKDDYLDEEFLQLLIDSGISLGFHGHQHLPKCFDELYQYGEKQRKMTIISASTLCAEPKNLQPGVPRSYNVVEIDTDIWSGRVHQRQMVNQLYNLPVWGPGHFVSTNKSYFDFELCQPLSTRPIKIELDLALDRADRLIGERRWREAVEILESLKDIQLARPLLVKALEELCDARLIIATLWPPINNREAVILGGAIIESGTKKEAENFLSLRLIEDAQDSSILEIARRIKERRTNE